MLVHIKLTRFFWIVFFSSNHFDFLRRNFKLVDGFFFLVAQHHLKNVKWYINMLISKLIRVFLLHLSMNYMLYFFFNFYHYCRILHYKHKFIKLVLNSPKFWVRKKVSIKFTIIPVWDWFGALLLYVTWQ